jgi:hypothetical protein
LWPSGEQLRFKDDPEKFMRKLCYHYKSPYFYATRPVIRQRKSQESKTRQQNLPKGVMMRRETGDRKRNVIATHEHAGDSLAHHFFA